MKIQASIVYLLSLASVSAINYDIDCGIYGSGRVRVDGSGMDFDMNLQNLVGPIVDSPGIGLTYHLHTLWNNEERFSDQTDMCTNPFTSLHYDPTFACGPASEARNLPECATRGAAVGAYNCNPDNPEGCEIGDLSGKYGPMVVQPDGTAVESVRDDPSAADQAHFVENNLVNDPAIWSSIVFHAAQGTRVLCCSIEQATGVGAGGDPHIKTWSGKWYDFMGACDLHLLKAPYFEAAKELVIDIRTKIRYGYSFIESAVVKIGEETMQVSSHGEYMLNGVNSAELPGMFAGYEVTHSQPNKKEHKFEIHIADDEKIVLSTFKDMVTVKMENTETSRFHGSLGMMGSYESGAMLARDGKTLIEDPNEFAAEWQVRADEEMLFSSVQGPQHPQKCEMPTQPMVQEKIRRLGESVAREAAEKACAHWPEDTRDAYIYDCLATGDLDLAAAGAF